jgi:hypothetical protein
MRRNNLHLHNDSRNVCLDAIEWNMHSFPTQNKESSTWSPVARIAGRDVRKLPQHAMCSSFLFGFLKQPAGSRIDYSLFYRPSGQQHSSWRIGSCPGHAVCKSHARPYFSEDWHSPMWWRIVWWIASNLLPYSSLHKRFLQSSKWRQQVVLFLLDNNNNNNNNNNNSVALVRKRTIPTERQPLFSEVSANFCG